MRKQIAIFIALSGLLVLVLCLSIMLGAIDIPLSVLWNDARSHNHSLYLILVDIRMPRAFAALLVGSALSMAGAAMQGLFRNPLVDPGIVGIMGGASLMVALSIVLVPTSVVALLPFNATYLYPVSAFCGGLLSTLLLYRLSYRGGQLHIASMILLGIALAAFTGAITGLLVYIANDQQLRSLTFWGMGSLASFNWVKVSILSVALLVILPLLLAEARALNAMMLGEDIARHLGFNIQRSKNMLILLVALLTGICVSFSGSIGFIGLVVPHIMRSMLGADHRILLPASALCGGIILSLADLFSRLIVSPAELPIGIVTSIIGAPFLAWLVWRRIVQERGMV